MTATESNNVSAPVTALDQAAVDRMVWDYTTGIGARSDLKQKLLSFGPAGIPSLFLALDQLTGYPRFLVMELIEAIVDRYPMPARTALRWAQKHRPLILIQTRAFLIYCWGKTLKQFQKPELTELFALFEDKQPLVRLTVLQVIDAHVDASFADELCAFLDFAVQDPHPLVRRRSLNLSRRLGLKVHMPWFLKLRDVFPVSEKMDVQNSLSLFS